MSGVHVTLQKVYAGGRERKFSLDVEFTASSGVTVIFGPSGSGKTTILECIAGLNAPDSGCVKVNGETLFDSSRRLNTPAQLRRIGYVFQDLALFPHMTVAENVGFGVRSNGKPRERTIEEALERFHISRLAAHRPGEISGGERQRVALARAVVIEPRLLLLDEPFSALDDELKSGIIADLRRWLAESRIPALFVTHDREEAMALGERMLKLKDGRIVGEETIVELAKSPELPKLP